MLRLFSNVLFFITIPMKSLITGLLLILFTAGIVPAQDYCNIVTHGMAYYSGGTNDNGTLNGLRADTVQSLGNGDSLFLSMYTIQPYLYTGLADVTGGIFGRHIVKRHDGLFQFINATGDTLSLRTAAASGESWTFCSLGAGNILRATVSSIAQVDFLGVNDTVKVVTFQAQDASGSTITHFYNGKSFWLSKHYGLIRLYDLFRMPDTSGMYMLEGRYSPRIGFQGVTVHDLYDFSIGDEFHYHGFKYYLWGNHVAHKDYRFIMRVLEKVITPGVPDTLVTYTWEYCKNETDISPVSQNHNYLYDTIQTSYKFNNDPLDLVFNWLPEKFTGTGMRYWTAPEMTIPGRAATGKRDNRWECCWHNYNLYQQYIKKEYEYAVGLGQVHYKNYWEYMFIPYYDSEDLVYYNTASGTWGWPVASDCHELIPVLSAQPDTLWLNWKAGSTDTLHIICNRPWTITIFDTTLTVVPMSGTGDGTVILRARYDNPYHYKTLTGFTVTSEAGEQHVRVVRNPSTLSTDEFSNPSLIMVPNPLKGTAILSVPELPSALKKELALYDMTGRLVFRDSFQGNSYRFDRGSLPPGIYFLQYQTDEFAGKGSIKVVLE